MPDSTNAPNYPSYQTYPTTNGFLATPGIGDYMLKHAAQINNSGVTVGDNLTVVSPALNYERAILRKAERDAFLNAYNGNAPGFKTLLASTYAQRQRASGK